jgi:hypothetical protein
MVGGGEHLQGEVAPSGGQGGPASVTMGIHGRSPGARRWGLQVGHQGHGDLGGVAKPLPRSSAASDHSSAATRSWAASPASWAASRSTAASRACTSSRWLSLASQSRPDRGGGAAPHDLVAEPGPVTVEAGDGDGAEPQVPVAPAASRQLPPGLGPEDQLAACRCARRAGLAIATAARRGHGAAPVGPGTGGAGMQRSKASVRPGSASAIHLCASFRQRGAGRAPPAAIAARPAGRGQFAGPAVGRWPAHASPHPPPQRRPPPPASPR